jgi:glycosyltransferase involved in cell wall biosynthesis
MQNDPSFARIGELTPRVTVIIPTYNRAALLGEAIKSVLAQHFTDLELIVVDDGSTDATSALLGTYRDARLRRMRQPHRGISSAMNLGLSAARGEYIARLDSDDIWHPNMLSTIVPVLNARPEIGVAYGKGQAMDAEGRPLCHTLGRRPHFPDDCLLSMVYDDFTCNIVTVARRECFQRAGGYDESLPGNEDWDIWLRIAQHYEFAFVDKVLAHYRWHDGNSTRTGSSDFQRILETRTVPLDKLFAQPNLPQAVMAMRPDAYENVYILRCLRLIEASKLVRARIEFVSAMRVSANPSRAALRISLHLLIVLICREKFGMRLIFGMMRLKRHVQTTWWSRASLFKTLMVLPIWTTSHKS